MDTNTLLQLKEELVTGRKNQKEIGNVIFQKEGKSWHTKEWKEKRKSILKEECEQCGGKENLLIQHLWHPMSYSDVRDVIKNKYRVKWREENSIDDVISKQDVIEYFDRLEKEVKGVCPNCFS